MKALALGIYNHIPNDGREFLCTDPNAVTIRAEDGRSIQKVDITPFIRDLPYAKPTVDFSTEDASGSTSIAASIIEAAEFGAKAILIDEDTAATNFLYRDKRMQSLVSSKMEPIKVLITKVKSLYEDCGCSTIMILGSCGDYIDVADCIICMQEYIPKDVTTTAAEIAKKIPSSQSGIPLEKMPSIKNRTIEIIKSSPTQSHGDHRPKIRGLHHILFENTELDLTSIQQIVHLSQTRSIAAAIFDITRCCRTKSPTLKDILKEFEEAQKISIDRYLLDLPSSPMDNISNKGMLAAIRGVDLAMALNRLRTIVVI